MKRCVTRVFFGGGSEYKYPWGLRTLNSSDNADAEKSFVDTRIQKDPGLDTEIKTPLNIAGLQLVSFYLLHQSCSIEMKEFSSLVFDPFGFLEGLQYQ